MYKIEFVGLRYIYVVSGFRFQVSSFRFQVTTEFRFAVVLFYVKSLSIILTT